MNILLKQMKTRFIENNKYSNWQIGFFIISLVFCFFQLKKYFENSFLERNGKIINVKIINKECINSGSRAQYVDVFYKNKKYNRIEIPNKEYCIGLTDTIPLIYNKNSDSFYVPNTIFMNERFVLGSFILVLASLFPWNKLDVYLKKKFKRRN